MRVKNKKKTGRKARHGVRICQNLETFIEMLHVNHSRGFHPFVCVFRQDNDDEEDGFRVEDYIFAAVEPDHTIAQALEAALKMFTGPAVDEVKPDVIN